MYICLGNISNGEIVVPHFEGKEEELNPICEGLAYMLHKHIEQELQKEKEQQKEQENSKNNS